MLRIVSDQVHRFRELDTGAEAAHQFQRGGDVAQVRHVAHGERFRTQQGGGEDRQRGVLGAGNADFTVLAGRCR